LSRWWCCRRSKKMSHHSDENLLTASSDSFWEPGNYKRTTKRIEDGHRLCTDLIQMVQERAEIEKNYAKSLKSWTKRWNELIDKGHFSFSSFFSSSSSSFPLSFLTFNFFSPWKKRMIKIASGQDGQILDHFHQLVSLISLAYLLCRRFGSFWLASFINSIIPFSICTEVIHCFYSTAYLIVFVDLLCIE